MSRIRLLVSLLGSMLALAGCGQEVAGTPWEWNLPPGFPLPHVPPDNPMTVEKVELGRHLFYDPRLSGNQTQSCGSCHQQALAFTDGLGRAVGSTGELHPRGSMGLANVAYASTLNWAQPLHVTLEQQALGPLLGTFPIVELGMEGREQELLARLRSDPLYVRLFAEAFPDAQDPFTLTHLTRALASFQRSLISCNSPYDRAVHRNEPDALSEAARRGMALFFSERLECFHCHEGFNFSAATRTSRSPSIVQAFFNTGLYDVDGAGAYPAHNTGLHEITGDPRDMGRFKPPSLRNVAVTAPYMHDGSLETLEEVLRVHYAAGGRHPQSPLKNGFMVGFELTPQELDDVIAFLHSLTDTGFLSDPAHADPFSSP